MSEPAKRRATYEDLYSIPENMTGEIVDGELIVYPRPAGKHVYAASALDKKIGSPYQFGEGGGPGGWIILVEPEIRLMEDTVVPDLAGWKRERFPVPLETAWFPVAPDWVCEILSPSTGLYDRTKKKATYAKHRVRHLWIVDPTNMTIEAYRLAPAPDDWAPVGIWGNSDKARIEPFQEIEINLGDLWLGLLQN